MTTPAEPAGAGQTAGQAPILLQVRPRRITILASVTASVVVVSLVVVGVLLQSSDAGVRFRVSDQIGLIGVGLVLGGLMMTAARPRLRVDRNGIWVRNVLGEQFTPWPLVLRISYPQGSPWAQAVMPDDEVKPLMAIQAMDRGRAVTALERVRDLQDKYGPPAPEPATPQGPRPEDDLQRPLGRLEIIDRQKAAERDRDLLRAHNRKSDRSARSGQPSGFARPTRPHRPADGGTENL